MKNILRLIASILCAAEASAVYCDPTWGFNFDDFPGYERLKSNSVVRSRVTVTVPRLLSQTGPTPLYIFPGLYIKEAFIQPLLVHGNGYPRQAGDAISWGASAVDWSAQNATSGTVVPVTVGERIMLGTYAQNGSMYGYVVSDNIETSTTGIITDRAWSYILSLEWHGDADVMMPAVTFNDIEIDFENPIEDLNRLISTKHANVTGLRKEGDGVFWKATEISFASGSCKRDSVN